MIGVPGSQKWAAEEADRLAEVKAKKAAFWAKQGKSHDKRDRQAKLLKEMSSGNDDDWDGAPNEITSKEIWETLIGREVAREPWIDGKTRERKLNEQSEDIADRLERVGIQSRYDRRITTLVGLCSEQVERVVDYRNCNMIPAMQSRNVHDMFKHVSYLCDTTPANQLRMMVVSGGWCRNDEYRVNHIAHCRRMSKFAADPLLSKLGVTLEYYNVENTIHRGEDGGAMLNLHSHAILRFRRVLGKKRMKQFLALARRYFPKGYVHDSALQKPAEAVKYVFKPAEFDLLSDNEFRELFLQIHGREKFDPETGEIEISEKTGKPRKEGALKFFHPLGSMRKFRQYLNDPSRRQKLMKVPTRGNNFAWRLTEKRKPKDAVKPSGAEKQVNVVVAITAPYPKFTQNYEPVLRVDNYNGDFSALLAQNGLQESFGTAKAIWRAKRLEAARQAEKEGAAGPLLSMKHTTTTTVPDRGGKIGGDYPPPHDLAGNDPPERVLQ